MVSGTSIKLQGNLNVGRGQLGFSEFATLSSDIVLWENFPSRPHRYFLNTGGVNRYITLPTIGTDENCADCGHNINIHSTATDGNIIVKDSTGIVIVNAKPGQSFALTAKAIPNVWIVVWASLSTFQDIYDISNNNPSITLTSNNGGINIRNPVNDAVIQSLNISSNDGSNVFFSVGNNTESIFDPSLSALGANATKGAAFGNQLISNKSGSFTVSDGSIALTTDTENRALFNMSNGLQLISGNKLPGTVYNSPNVRWEQTSAITTDADTPTTLFSYTIPVNTVLVFHAVTVGARTGGLAGSIGDSWMYDTKSKARNVNSTLYIYSPFIHAIEDVSGPIITTTTSNSDIKLQINGILNNDITWLTTIYITEFKYA